MLFKKKNGEAENVITAASENDHLFKRLGDPGYLLLHPEMIRKAVILEFVQMIAYAVVFCPIVLWVYTEIMAFIWMISTYGFVR